MPSVGKPIAMGLVPKKGLRAPNGMRNASVAVITNPA